MNTNKTVDAKLISFTAVAAILGAGMAMAATASADSGFGLREARGECDPERHDAIEVALEEGDYDAWKELMGDRGRIAEVVTEDNFDTFAAMHEAMEEGDTEEAAELREELGLGMHPQDGSGYQQGSHMGKMHRGMGAGDGTNNRWGN